MRARADPTCRLQQVVALLGRGLLRDLCQARVRESGQPSALLLGSVVVFQVPLHKPPLPNTALDVTNATLFPLLLLTNTSLVFPPTVHSPPCPPR